MRRAVEWLLAHGSAGLFLDPGLGKTAITLKALTILKKAKVMKRALIVAPLRVCRMVWPDEIKKWKDFNGLRWVFLHGNGKDDLIQEDADIYVINYDGLQWLFDENYRRFKALELDTLVIDESSKMKHTRTKRFKAVKPMLPTFARRWILTGSPNPNGYLDLFGQVYIMDLGHALGRYITHYRMTYFSPLDRNGWNWALKSGADKLIQKAIKPYVIRLEAEDYIKMPQEIQNIVRVELPGEARRVYDELEGELITRLDREHVVTAASVGASYTKCAQVANGGLYHMPAEMDFTGGTMRQLIEKVRIGRTWTNLHEAKLDAVEDLLEELQGSPALVVYDFDHDLARLKERFGPDTPTIPGKRDSQLIDEWNAGKLPLLLVQPQSVGHGLNMQYGPGHHVIWHSLIFDYELFDQLNRRLRRQGSKHETIFVHLIIARDTVDDAKLRALRKKNRTQAGFLASLKDYARARS